MEKCKILFYCPAKKWKLKFGAGSSSPVGFKDKRKEKRKESKCDHFKLKNEEVLGQLIGFKIIIKK